MKRLKLKHAYHDAHIREIQYRDNSDVILDVDLCSCCNPSVGQVTVSLLSVRNFSEVQKALESARLLNAGRMYVDEIIGIVRDDDRGYLIDFSTAGTVHVDAHGLHES